MLPDRTEPRTADTGTRNKTVRKNGFRGNYGILRMEGEDVPYAP